MHQDAIAASLPWYRTLNREQWRALLVSNIGWLFDGFEIYALFLTVGFALHQLLETAQLAALPYLPVLRSPPRPVTARLLPSPIRMQSN